jgi:hypothetical protein
MQHNLYENSVDDLLFVIENFQLNLDSQQTYISFSTKSEDDILEAIERDKEALSALLNTIENHLSLKSNAYMLSLLNTCSVSGASLFYLLDPPLVIPVINLIEKKMLSFLPKKQIDKLLLSSFRMGEKHSFLAKSQFSNDSVNRNNYLYVFNNYLKETVKNTDGLFKRNLLNEKHKN